MPPLTRAVKIRLEVSAGGKLEVVKRVPPANSIYGTTRPNWWLEVHRTTTGSKPPPYTRSVSLVTNIGTRLNPYSRLPRNQLVPTSPVTTFPTNTPARQSCSSVTELRFYSPVAPAIQTPTSQLTFST